MGKKKLNPVPKYDRIEVDSTVVRVLALHTVIDRAWLTPTEAGEGPELEVVVVGLTYLPEGKVDPKEEAERVLIVFAAEQARDLQHQLQDLAEAIPTIASQQEEK